MHDGSDEDEIPAAAAAPAPRTKRIGTFTKLSNEDAEMRRGAHEVGGADQDLAALAKRQYTKRRRRASIVVAASDEQLKLRETARRKSMSTQFELVDAVAELTNAQAAAAAAAAFEAETRPRRRTWTVLSRMRASLVVDEKQLDELSVDPLALPPPSCVDGIIHPLSVLRRRWDMFLFSLLAYCAITIPYRVGFEVVAVGPMMVVETMVDVFFIIDIFVRFRMGYTIDSDHLDSRIEMRPGKIAKAYCKSWFVIDVASGIPTQLLTLLFMEEEKRTSGTAATRLPRLLRMPRLVRMMRLMKLLRVMRFFRSDTSGVLKRLVEGLGMPPGSMRAVRLMVVIVVVAHTAACSWFFCHSIVSHNSSGCEPSTGCEPVFSWWDKYCGRQSFAIDMGLNGTQLTYTAEQLASEGFIQPPRCEDLGLRYIVSLYWAVTTLTTMGYGDIGSQQPWEYGFSVVVMLMGVSCYAYIASNVSIVLSSLDQEKTEMREHLEKLEHFMDHKRLTLSLRRRLRTFFNEYVHRLTKSKICLLPP